jgi:response regulator NasT
MSRSLRIAVADDERDTREYLQELLTRLGHQVVAAATGQQLVEQCRLLRPDLIVTDIKMPDLDGIEAAGAVSREKEIPVVLVSGHLDADLLRRAETDHIMSYLIKPVSQADVEAAVALAMHRFEQYQAVRKEARDLKHALEDRKVIERAKGVVMKRLGVDEQEAFRRLKRMASGQNRKLIDVGQAILAAEDVFHQMDNL